jgi:hypothetical protein
MRPSFSTILSAMMLAVAFSGCSNDPGPLNAAFVATPADAAKTSYHFDASSSTGKDLKYHWDFGDRTEGATTKTADHKYQYPNGAYKVSLTVTDGSGATKTATKPVPVGSGENKGPILFLKADKRYVAPEEPVLFDATQSYDPDGDPIFFIWDFNSQLSEQDFRGMQNLGDQAYGRYKNGPPPGGAANGTSGPPPKSGGLLVLDAAQVQQVRERMEERLGIGFHGASSGPEPRNPNFNGRVDDTSPKQFFQFPAPATYFVLVRVEDIKGDGMEGYLKIKVDPNVPKRNDTKKFSGDLIPGALDPLAQAASQPDRSTNRAHDYEYSWGATTNVAVTLATVPAGVPDLKVSLYICGSGLKAINQCKDGSGKDQVVGQTKSFTFAFKEQLPVYPYSYHFWIVNDGNANVHYDMKLDSVFDINPWSDVESGVAQPH